MSSSPLKIPSSKTDSWFRVDRVLSSHEKQFLAAIVESSEDAIIGESLDGTIRLWNRGAEKMFGYRAEEVIGRAVSILHAQADSEELVQTLGLISQGKSASHFETTRLRKDGTRVNVSISISPVHDENGILIGGAKIIRDVTDRKRAEEILQRAEKLGVASRFAASVAHELNNPLAAVTNLLFLARKEELSSSASRYLEMADKELARVSHITTQALGFYQETALPAQQGLSAIMEEALSIHHHRISATGIRVQRRYEISASLSCHGGELRQVLVNLIGNALDAMAGSGTLILSVRNTTFPTSNHPGVRISVADTGSGIPREVSSHLFEPFFTTRGPTSLGLGLWMCEQIVARHRGLIRVKSSQGPRNHGTVVMVFLPTSTEF